MCKCPECKKGSLIEITRTKGKFNCKCCGSEIEIEIEHDGSIFRQVDSGCSCGYKIKPFNIHDYWCFPEKIISVYCDDENCKYEKDFSNVS